MTFSQVGSIKYFQFKIFENQDVIHAVFTRQGGFSPKPWESLNFGASVGDDISRVRRNREVSLQAVNLQPQSVYDLFQVHSDEVVITNSPLQPQETHRKADAILTNKPGVTLMMRFADCVPILLYDPEKRAIGIVHAGWQGTVKQIVKNALEQMIGRYDSNPASILAAIGPSIGPDHYMVGAEVIEQFSNSFGDEAANCIYHSEGKDFLDLWKANQILLKNNGVEKIEISGICTACNLDDWFSHRGEHGKTGRFGVVFCLQH